MNPSHAPAVDRLRRWQRVSLVVGVLALVVCCLEPGLSLFEQEQLATPTRWTRADLHPFLQAYLVAYVFWTGIAVGCLALAMLHHLVHGAWGLSSARLFEAGGATLPLIAVLFVPLALGAGMLYPWAYDEALRHELPVFKARYLSEAGFILRGLVYLATWMALSFTLRRWSARRDQGVDERLTLHLRRLSAGGLVAVALTFSFAAIDWMMSIEPLWYSTMYGAIVALTALLGAFAFVLTILSRLESDEGIRATVSPDVYNDLGNLLLAFVIISAYLSYSQYLIIWSGNTLEEIGWYQRRLNSGWETVALCLVALHFVVPFLLLLSKPCKRRPASLARVAGGLLLMDYLHILWLVAPAFREQAYRIRGVGLRVPDLHWLDLVMPIALGGLWFAAFCWNAARRPLISPHDPAWSKFETHGEAPHA